MQFVTNAGKVRDRLAWLRDRGIPAAVRQATAPAPWVPAAREEAERVLNAIATEEQRRFIPDFVRTVSAALLTEGFVLNARKPFLAPVREPVTVASAGAAQAAISPFDRGMSLFQKSAEEFEQMVVEWVETVKHKDRRDWGKTDEEIAHFITEALLSPYGAQWLVREGPNKGRTVREVFLPHITEFIRAKQAEQDHGLTQETLAGWLQAVLVAWRALVREQMPERICAALRAQG